MENDDFSFDGSEELVAFHIRGRESDALSDHKVIRKDEFLLIAAVSDAEDRHLIPYFMFEVENLPAVIDAFEDVLQGDPTREYGRKKSFTYGRDEVTVHRYHDASDGEYSIRFSNSTELLSINGWDYHIKNGPLIVDAFIKARQAIEASTEPGQSPFRSYDPALNESVETFNPLFAKPSPVEPDSLFTRIAKKVFS